MSICSKCFAFIPTVNQLRKFMLSDNVSMCSDWIKYLMLEASRIDEMRNANSLRDLVKFFDVIKINFNFVILIYSFIISSTDFFIVLNFTSHTQAKFCSILIRSLTYFFLSFKALIHLNFVSHANSVLRGKYCVLWCHTTKYFWLTRGDCAKDYFYTCGYSNQIQYCYDGYSHWTVKCFIK